MKNKAFNLILLILVLIISFLIIRNTYSKYITQAQNDSNFNILKWNILLNDEDIKNKKDFTKDIQISYVQNENIAQGVVVPTSKGSFALSLESTGTELPFEFEITLADQKPYSIKINNTTTKNESSIYLYDISLSITNTSSTVNSWELSFELPDTLVSESCSFSEIDSYIIDDNKVTLTSATSFSNNETKTLNMILALPNTIDFQINNVTLNRINFDYLTDRVSDFKITSYSLNGTETNLSPFEHSVTGIVIPPEDITQEVINNFIFTVEWYDGKDNVLDNSEDVMASKGTIPATIPVTLKVTQINN